MLTAPISITQGLAPYSARSEFSTESGAITGDALAVGGTWTGVGDADDFSESSDTAQRSAVSDTATDFTNGRIVVASGPTLTDTVVQVDFKVSAVNTGANQGLIARYADTSNALGVMAFLDSSSRFNFRVRRRIAGTTNTLVPATPALHGQFDAYYTLRVSVDSRGNLLIWLGPQGSVLTPVWVFLDPTLATGGALASGKVGIVDWQPSATAATRTYDNFAAWVPPPDAVAFAGQSTQLTTDGMIREDSGGTAYGPVSRVTGANCTPRFPVPANSGGTVETMLIPSTGDLDQLPDTMGTASISARNFRRPSWLFVPNE